jgi:hypothetical protein
MALTGEREMSMQKDAFMPTMLETFDWVNRRLRARIETMTNDEYFWEPVEGCMTLRRQNGSLVLDPRREEGDGPAPFTTLAWRICHIGGGVLQGFAEALTNGAPSEEGQRDWPEDADSARAFLDMSYSRWRAAFAALPADMVWQRLGDAWQPFEDGTWGGLAIHVLDEVVHHGAEVGTVRDLYAHRR